MYPINDETTYDQKVSEFKTIYEDNNISDEQKIAACEEIVFSNYCKFNNRFDCMDYLLNLYEKVGRYQDIINFIMLEFKSRFTANEFHDAETNWFLIIAAANPSLSFRVVDAAIALKDYTVAKSVLLGLKENRFAMLNMHQNDGLRHECVFWYSHVLSKYAQIAILEGDADTASDYLTDDFWQQYDYRTLEAMYYTAKVWSGKVSPGYKNKLSLDLYSQIAELDITSDKYDEEERQMIIDSNYQLGMVYATDPQYYNQTKAIQYLQRAMSLGYPITNEDITRITQSTPQTSYQTQSNSTSTNTNNSSKGGCYVATAVYGSYDCPPVWTLRRFRDNTLSQNLFGRLFIKVYYAISPTLVKWFGDTNWFKKMWKKPLDKLVVKLQNSGMESTPYDD